MAQVQNPLLQKLQQATEAKVPEQLKGAYKGIIAAGEKVMYSPQSHKMMMQQMSQGDPADAAGEGIAKLLAILLHEMKGALNMKAAIPAMTHLLCDALDFMEQAGKCKVDNDLLATAVKEMGSSILQILGATPDKMQGMMAKGKTMQKPEVTVPSQEPAGLINQAQGA